MAALKSTFASRSIDEPDAGAPIPFYIDEESACIEIHFQLRPDEHAVIIALYQQNTYKQSINARRAENVFLNVMKLYDRLRKLLELTLCQVTSLL